MRSLPDLVMESSNGTSQASPTLAGILALATQEHGDSLGPINQALYGTLGPTGAADGIVDVTQGNNSGGKKMPGYTAGPGYDVASGWGTVYAPNFVPALVSAVSAEDQRASTPSQQAAAALSALRSNITVSRRTVTPGQAVTVTGTGFIPGATQPGTELVDQKIVKVKGSKGSPWDAITATVSPHIPASRITHDSSDPSGTAEGTRVSGATSAGSATVRIDTSGLAKGKYTVTLAGKLLSEQVKFTVK
jgi:hypothetical protein